MTSTLEELIRRWSDIIEMVSIVNDREVFDAVTYRSNVKERVAAKLRNLGVTYLSVKPYSRAIKLQGTLSSEEFYLAVKDIIHELFGYTMEKPELVFYYNQVKDMPVGENHALTVWRWSY